MEHHSHDSHKKVVFETDNMHHVDRKAPHYGHHHHYSSKIAHFIATHSGGLIKTNTQASYVMFGIAVLFFVLSFFFFFAESSTTQEPTTLKVPPGKEIVRPYNAPPYVR
ncbi:MAG: hypothetical protein COV34_03355 [Candidatus Zambryskibacteria bacterium CG10_big_fil_rev_8_21_14_0_10_42_12]|uniref:Transmembrane protein n=1 Tax=Candidatus Zambryskibacteria bacterium CG10_big_fil_rev_8_21_14_0_10_42_12 TaxID=1975115 RepID=A0A2H0QSK9_9BACT|nr:MAG: hypothetical protein COV34_03355 [Candidatus Zambryskibacteria bacterium CG10_big_fil_rev_8_21_14_0_10_42_12]